MFLMGVRVNEQVVNVDNACFNTIHAFSKSRWKEAGHPNRPIGLVIHLNCPLPGIVNAVR